MAHIPVLLAEVLEHLVVRQGGRYLDATGGEGGYAEAMLRDSSPNGRVTIIEWDPASAHKLVEKFSREEHRVRVLQGNFRDLSVLTQRVGMTDCDGAVFDLGLSRATLEESGRGFSFQRDEPLLMTFSDEASAGTACDLVNRLPAQELAKIFREYGEERFAQRIANAIVQERQREPLVTSGQLAALIRRSVPRSPRIHPATRVFQALRIAVNGELENLSVALPAALGLLRSGGRLVVVSYHSLEDRIVKRFFRAQADAGTARILTKKPVIPGSEERRINPSSRSAKLRSCEKL